MNDLLLKLYHLLPTPARSITASLRGHYLRRLRYSAETEALVEEIFEREHWSAAQWKTWREERLAQVLHQAATKVPYYRAHWLERRRHGDKSSIELLENWPLLDKEALRAKEAHFVAEDCDLRRMIHEHTSGTTGKPLNLWFSRKTVRAWYALNEARWRRWYGVSLSDRWAILGGQLVVSVGQRRPPFWVWNVGLNQLYLSSYHLSPDNAVAYLNALRHYRVTYLLGYASSMYVLAKFALEKGLETPTLKVAISNAEPLYEHQRETIADAFKCPVRDTYGMSEAVCAASECETGKLHLWPEVGILEVIQDNSNQPVLDGQSGRFICTGLLNSDMPLIRFQVGDRGEAVTQETTCACQRTLPMLQKVEGRLDDVLLTRDGRHIGRLDPIFKGDLPIREAQIIQESVDYIRVLLVPASGYTGRDGQRIVQRLRERVGNIEIILEPVDSIPRTKNGKFRAVISNVKF